MIYEDMRQWVVDRQQAQRKLDEAETVYQQQAQQRYCDWLDEQKPEWLNEMEQPEEKA